MTRAKQREEKMLNGVNAIDDNLLQKASAAMDRALMENEGSWSELSFQEESTDREAEGAVLYAISRGSC